MIVQQCNGELWTSPTNEHRHPSKQDRTTLTVSWKADSGIKCLYFHTVDVKNAATAKQMDYHQEKGCQKGR